MGSAVGHLQDLLRGHGYSILPDPRAEGYGSYGHVTAQAVANYRERHGFATGTEADGALLADIVARPAGNAVLGAAYVPLVLNVPFTPVARFVWLTALFETGGAFGSMNLNTDGCGVSFGILQWSQSSGQLHTLLKACLTSEPSTFGQIMDGTDVVDYTGKANGGVDAKGRAVDPNFELTAEPWKSRFSALGTGPTMQRVQLDLATAAYAGNLIRMQQYATAIRSQRGFGFLLDLANQFGAGRVKQFYQANATSGDTEAAVLLKLENAFSNIASPQFQPQVRARRAFFRTTTLLSDEPLGLKFAA